MKLKIPGIKSGLCLLAVGLAMTACAAVHYAPTQLDPIPATAAAPVRTLARDTSITFDTGYQRQLKAGSSWQRVGTVPQGEVYRPVQDVFTVEGANMHEAYLIVRNDQLVGFYLPAEHGFSALGKPQPLRLTP